MDNIFHCILISSLVLTSSNGIFSEQLPDLVPDPYVTFASARIVEKSLEKMTCALEEGCASSSAFKIEVNSTDWFTHTRLLFVFATISWNFGDKDFSSTTDPKEWQWHTCHDHYHSMENFAHYDILDSQGELAAEGHKASYCLRDTVCLDNYHKNYNCEGKNDQGVSVGCADLYSHTTDCQWIDMTDVKPGNYTFQTHINPLRIVPEHNYDNNVVNCDIEFDGKVAFMNSCVLGGVKIGDACQETSDCAYHHSKCVNNKCDCESGYSLYDVKTWMKVCTADCDPKDPDRCKNGGERFCQPCLECTSKASYGCRCAEGYSGDVCQWSDDGPKVGDKCNTAEDCQFAYAVCSDSRCQCAPGYRRYRLNFETLICAADCDPNEDFVCENGGTRSCPMCRDCEAPAPYTCKCKRGFSGQFCEEAHDGCKKKINKSWKRTIKVGKHECKRCTCKKLSRQKKLFKKACKGNIKGTKKNCCKLCQNA